METGFVDVGERVCKVYKVVIVDDESTVLEGLSREYPWENWNCKVIATANDGEQGRKIIEKYRPDIVFSDIAMPSMDGLTMIAGLKSEFKDIEVSILTGHRNFEYAQQAVSLGVRRFLLKPSSMEEIGEATRAMMAHVTGRGESLSEVPGVGKVGQANCFIVKNAVKYIEEHYNEKLTLSDVADKTYVSQWHLSKLLNKHMGHGFSEILNTIRIHRAKELLKEQSLRIGDVAEMVGFLDVAHFSRVFKKIEGISANEYRNTID